MPNTIEDSGIRLLEQVRSDLPDAMKAASANIDEMARLAGKSIIWDAFHGLNGRRWADQTKAEHSYNGSTFGAELSIDVWTTDEVGHFPSAERWRAKYGGEPSNIWVTNLIFDQGIIGLPAYASHYEIMNGEPYSGPGWDNGTNKHFHMYTPVRTVFESANPRWDAVVDRIVDIIAANI